MSIERLFIGVGVGALMFFGCSDHNPNSMFNPNSPSYDSTVWLDANQDGIADILQISSNNSSSSGNSSQVVSSQALSSQGISSQNQSSQGVSSVEEISSSALSSSSSGLYKVTVTNGSIVGTGLNTGNFASLATITIQTNISSLSLGSCFDGWTSSDLIGLDLAGATVTFEMPNHDVALSGLVSACPGQFTDLRDRHRYSYASAGGLTWMMNNVAFDTPDTTDWCYENSTIACDTLGRLYTWDAAQSACPTGWRLPTISEIRKNQASLDLQKAGNRETWGTYTQLDNMGFYWTSGPFSAIAQANDNFNNCTDESTCAVDWVINGNSIYAQHDKTALGFSIRCVSTP